ncbi:MAG: ABC transporter permease [Mesorhizobium sp.]|uniref:ABC transporter permease n=1 Tax=unclassified Mesorhizobium TaxID=325217 RepID=UPI000FCB7B39|nr:MULTISPECIES: ABC transporter permease [unclassified Mesorhizobium]RUV41075.1 ABC transporter permease [Mesorhizobium sp. M1A.T.Ca.IN.004.03.1.1]RWG23315.1 MAG: ABC transporter permease [Mesorhizobium sp.]RWK30831.1 MAG: ABC transporter permease [Mesorhizobium sp.]RWK91397.1 MAG: ABC transporter permease [Mesorhizobium sp.]TIP18908.1 MAG: ABC transporter permease [Mesorhizobium sp.]
MVEVFTALLSQVAPYALAVGGTLVAAIAWGFHQRLAGARAERHRQQVEELAARDIADQVQNDVGALPADAARKELGTWSKG